MQFLCLKQILNNIIFAIFTKQIYFTALYYMIFDTIMDLNPKYTQTLRRFPRSWIHYIELLLDCLSCGIYAVCYWLCLEMDYDYGDWFCMLDIRFVDGLCIVLTFIYSVCTNLTILMYLISNVKYLIDLLHWDSSE